MSSSASNWLENQVMNAVFNDTDMAFTTGGASPTTVYAKLHIGAPGEDCTDNPAVETTRKALSFGTSSNGVVTSDANAEWTNVTAPETYTAISIWDDLTVGNPICFIDLTTPRAVTAGDNFRIASTALTVTLT